MTENYNTDSAYKICYSGSCPNMPASKRVNTQRQMASELALAQIREPLAPSSEGLGLRHFQLQRQSYLLVELLSVVSLRFVNLHCLPCVHYPIAPAFRIWISQTSCTCLAEPAFLKMRFGRANACASMTSSPLRLDC